VDFARKWGFYLGVSDCEVLVGLLTGDDVGYSEYNFKTELEIQYLTVMQLLPIVGDG
jgi:hypothetical protein